MLVQQRVRFLLLILPLVLLESLSLPLLSCLSSKEIGSTPEVLWQRLGHGSAKAGLCNFASGLHWISCSLSQRVGKYRWISPEKTAIYRGLSRWYSTSQSNLSLINMGGTIFNNQPKKDPQHPRIQTNVHFEGRRIWPCLTILMSFWTSQ